MPAPVRPAVAPVLVVLGERDLPALPAYAAVEADRRRAAVHLLRVLPLLRSPGQGDDRSRRAWERHDRASEQLARVARCVREATGGPPARVSTEIAHGPWSRSLRARTDAAAIVLVGHGDELVPTGGGRWPLAWVVAAESTAPVVVVPGGWPGRDPDGRREVVAVVDPQDGAATLRASAREARRRRVGFRVLRLSRRDVETRADTVAAAVARSTSTAVVVVVQRRHAVRTTDRLGPLAEVALRRTGCPVMVVDPGPREQSVTPAGAEGPSAVSVSG